MAVRDELVRPAAIAVAAIVAILVAGASLFILDRNDDGLNGSIDAGLAESSTTSTETTSVTLPANSSLVVDASTAVASSTTTPSATTETTSAPMLRDGSFPANVAFDYQIGSPYDPATGVAVVSRDWSSGQPLGGGSYSICYVNAFQTQPDGSGARIDERSNWPADVVLTSLGDDPNWEGEFLIDLSTSAKRQTAAAHLADMVDTCAAKGFDAVEFDNLDSWTRIDGLPFGRADAIAFAALITDHAHAAGLAAAQKNTVGLSATEARTTIGFDFAIIESCGQYDECGAVAEVYGPDAIYIEYADQHFASACAVVGDRSSVVRRDRNVTAPGSGSYTYDEC